MAKQNHYLPGDECIVGKIFMQLAETQEHVSLETRKDKNGFTLWLGPRGINSAIRGTSWKYALAESEIFEIRRQGHAGIDSFVNYANRAYAAYVKSKQEGAK